MTQPDTSGYYRRDADSISYAARLVSDAGDTDVDLSAVPDGWTFYPDQASAMAVLDADHTSLWPGDPVPPPTPPAPPPTPVRPTPPVKGAAPRGVS